MRLKQPRASVVVLLSVAAYASAPSAGAEEAPSPRGSTPAKDARAAAAELFARGVELARVGRYAEAEQAFLEAYRVHPHYAVLYNVAQAALERGDERSALAYFERFLAEGGERVSAELRVLVGVRVLELRRRLESEASPAPDRLAPSPEAAATPAAEVPEAPATPVAASAPAAHTAPRVIAAASLPPPGEVEPARGNTRGLILSASGATLLSTALGLYVWNSGRFALWQTERDALDELPNRSEALRTDPRLWQQARANNELLASVQRVDLLALGTAGVGLLALGASAWDLLARPAPAPSRLALTASSIHWSTTW